MRTFLAVFAMLSVAFSLVAYLTVLMFRSIVLWEIELWPSLWGEYARVWLAAGVLCAMFIAFLCSIDVMEEL